MSVLRGFSIPLLLFSITEYVMHIFDILKNPNEFQPSTHITRHGIHCYAMHCKYKTNKYSFSCSVLVLPFEYFTVWKSLRKNEHIMVCDTVEKETKISKYIMNKMQSKLVLLKECGKVERIFGSTLKLFFSLLLLGLLYQLLNAGCAPGSTCYVFYQLNFHWDEPLSSSFDLKTFHIICDLCNTVHKYTQGYDLSVNVKSILECHPKLLFCAR